MAALRQLRTFTPDEYLAVETQADYKSEYYQGQIYAMAGGTIRHSQIAINVIIDLSSALADKPCQVFNSDLRLNVQPNGLYAYPDVMVICGKVELLSGRQDTVTNPVLIVEVLSESTRDYDMTFKFELYRALPTLEHYVLVDSDKAFVRYFRKLGDGQWLMQEWTHMVDVLDLTPLDAQLALAQIYRSVEFGA